jgi:kanamycin kinase/streptomycin 3"-kinase/aminoglycoside 3'-phosphotransferase-2
MPLRPYARENDHSGRHPVEVSVESAEWVTVRTGMSGADVRRSPDGGAYAKSGSGNVREDLVAERERLEWLAGTDLPGAEILDWDDDGATATLTLRTVPGVPLSELTGTSASVAAESLGRFLARLHATPRESCPFERWLAVTVAVARVRVDKRLVDEGDFDDERAGRSAQDVLRDLLDQRPRAEDLETADLVVCHGDACLPNFLADPDTCEVTGMVDVHRLGIADRHLDLALATRSSTDVSLNPGFGPEAGEALLAAYGRDSDPWRLEFYRLLDEFF